MLLQFEMLLALLALLMYQCVTTNMYPQLELHPTHLFHRLICQLLYALQPHLHARSHYHARYYKSGKWVEQWEASIRTHHAP